MTVSRADAAAAWNYRGTDYYFCHPRCLQRFQADPQKYLEGGPGRMEVEAVSVPSGQKVTYICPMCPGVETEEPAACPSCGMALEPRLITTEEHNPELDDLQRCLAVGLLVGLPVLIVAMGPMIPGLSFLKLGAWNYPLQALLTTIVVGWCGFPFWQRAWSSLVHRSPNMFTLVGLGVAAAYLFSLFAVLVPDWFPEGFRRHGTVEPYFESAAVIVVLVLGGQVMELRARRRTNSALRQLLSMAPKTARVIGPDGRDNDLPLELVQVGDRLRVRPGERVPVDGVLLEGTSSIDESMISGEPIPVAKTAGETVIGGTLNGTGSFVVRADRVGSDTILARIVQMVSEAQRSRAPVQQLVDRVAGWFVPVVLLIAVATFLGWWIWGKEAPAAQALVHATAVLIIACPCALGLATPMAIVVGMGRGARLGILVRNVESLEMLHKADTLVLDKTGTLTEGKPRLLRLDPAEGMHSDELLSLVAGLERSSEHPLSHALMEAARKQSLDLPEASAFEAVPGKGVKGNVQGKVVVVGNPALLAESGIDLGDRQEREEEARRRGETVLFVGVDGRNAGTLGIIDPIREGSAEMTATMRTLGLRLVMLSGDNKTTATAVAAQLGIDEVIAEVLPHEKGAVVERLRREGRITAMAGDGINDAPALALADVGIALATGTDIAMESAGITLVRGDLRGIVRARRLSRDLLHTIRRNLILAFLYNSLSIPLAALGWINPMLAGLAMSLSSLSVIVSSLLLNRINGEPSGEGKDLTPNPLP